MKGRAWSKAFRLIALSLALTLVFAAVAQAAVTIVENAGVGRARLGMSDSTCASRLGRVVKKGRDSSYENQVVYYFCFGRRLSSGAYPLVMYSNRSHRVFSFVVNSSGYVTRRGIRVSSTESALRRAYGSKLRRYRGSVYTRYTLGSRPGTDFYVKGGRVRKIVVRTY